MPNNYLKEKLEKNPFIVLGKEVYKVLYNDIIQLNILPGTRLSESKIAKEFGTSRTPVKNAIDRLKEDGLVVSEQGKPYVITLNKREGRQLYEARLALEGYAVFLAATRISDSQLERLHQLVIDYNNSANTEEFLNHAYYDHEFHKTIMEAADSPYIMHLYETIESRILHYRNSLLINIPSHRFRTILSRAGKCHTAIYNAIRLGFAEIAKNEMERDINGMMDVFVEWN
ncbi:GntR family transcriptional regulator [Oceanobacillus sojae]|uniref:GntR family transcriptional regulator n=1 Tax=Oceanobacillus sojae TaxID=582851 RepID=UPI0009889057|nr:GntR family transcriptional regulator [Oceanobacillus sojae]MCT1903736.1 GntR family transcriptional regulator [Oceanobacillus sojae]